MNWTIPGTVLPANGNDAEKIETMFSSMLLAGGLTLSQIAGITGLEPYAIQNWVKRGFLAPPVQKKYALSQLCRVMTINMLKPALQMEDICGLLQYVNGDLEDSSDDLIDDAQLYFLFIRLAVDHRQMNNPQGRDARLEELLADYAEPVPGAKERVKKVLCIMLTAWAASLLRQNAEKMVQEIK